MGINFASMAAGSAPAPAPAPAAPAGITLDLNKNTLLDITKRNPGLKRDVIEAKLLNTLSEKVFDESILPEKNEQLSFEGENSEFYARTCAKCKDGRQKEIVHFSHEFTSEWDWNHNQVKSMYVDNEFLFSCLLKEARMRYLRNENVEFEPLDEAIVIGWTYADETKCKLTPDGIHYTKIYNTED